MPSMSPRRAVVVGLLLGVVMAVVLVVGGAYAALGWLMQGFNRDGDADASPTAGTADVCLRFDRALLDRLVPAATQYKSEVLRDGGSCFVSHGATSMRLDVRLIPASEAATVLAGICRNDLEGVPVRVDESCSARVGTVTATTGVRYAARRDGLVVQADFRPADPVDAASTDGVEQVVMAVVNSRLRRGAVDPAVGVVAAAAEQQPYRQYMPRCNTLATGPDAAPSPSCDG
ncbi:hypothetical protein ABT297_15670 [Dactylosporangium sp. NPDC000555]|uniref:hypothetical protein n=1 Tax=Dactylosporangium sp. NPDC000555 TaxID=3154260 RepID=UPI00332C3BEA